MVNHNSTKNHFSVVVKKVRAAVLRANYLANGHAQRLILKLMDSKGQQDAKYQHTIHAQYMYAWLHAHLFSAKNGFSQATSMTHVLPLTHFLGSDGHAALPRPQGDQTNWVQHQGMLR